MMATITFLKNNQPLELENIAVALGIIQNWADRNEFTSLTLHLESENKLRLQLEDEAVLSHWLDLATLHGDDSEIIEQQLDFAKLEYRRRLSGFGRFDR